MKDFVGGVDSGFALLWHKQKRSAEVSNDVQLFRRSIVGQNFGLDRLCVCLNDCV